MSQPYHVTFRFTAQECLDLRGVIVDQAGGRVQAHSWEHAVIEAAAMQPAPLMPACFNAIVRGDFEVRGDDGDGPQRRRCMGAAKAQPKVVVPAIDEPF